MPNTSRPLDKKRKRPAGAPRKIVSKQKRLKRAAAYHSSSEDEEDELPNAEPGILENDEQDPSEEEDGIQLGNIQNAEQTNVDVTSKALADLIKDEDLAGDEDLIDSDAELEADEGSEFDSDSDEQSTTSTSRQRPKRADPQAFATSIERILNSKLTTTKRADPILSRSKAAQQTVRDQADSKLEEAARRKMRADKNAKREQGRVKDVLGLQSSSISTGEVVEEERRLKRLAQKGVVKLFNAVRAAQVSAYEAETGAKKQGVVGIDRRKEKVDEMSKKGFLDLLSAD